MQAPIRHDYTTPCSVATEHKDAEAFNGDIYGWIISSVTDMSYMFQNATSFNQDLES